MIIQDTRLARNINLPQLLEKKSHFLLGPRSTGKSSLIMQQLGTKACLINLLRLPLQARLLNHPGDLESIIDATPGTDPALVAIDEIQKIPALLDEVHRLIEERGLRFLLSGSSARRLKSSGVNLLGGRAWVAHLFPLTFSELPDFDLERMLLYGGLPQVYLSEYPKQELEAYVTTYVNEEIKMEGLVRKIPSFLGFLRAAALSNTQQINFTQVASDAGVSPTTIREYYAILEDTLIGTMLEPWTKSVKRKAVTTGKFYFFDTGVCHALAETEHLDGNSDLYGKSFEHWVSMELRAFLGYREKTQKLRFWRTQDQKEVDFVIGDEVAIEVKATRKVSKSDLAGIRALQSEEIIGRFFLVSRDPVDTLKDGIHCLHWKSFMTMLWAGKVLS